MTPAEANTLAQFIGSKDDEIIKQRAEIERLCERREDQQAEIEALRAALHGLLDLVMCFAVDPPSAALNHAMEEASRALEHKP